MNNKKELNPEDCQREVLGATSPEGVRTMLYFFDENDEPCLEKDADRLLAVEYDKDGKEVFTIRAFIRH